MVYHTAAKICLKSERELGELLSWYKDIRQIHWTLIENAREFLSKSDDQALPFHPAQVWRAMEAVFIRLRREQNLAVDVTLICITSSNGIDKSVAALQSQSRVYGQPQRP